ncbi:hypothetical protein JL721_8350 [Aureococcus anophagefferens]|nr:hypothetical protein JL721_8350 [Aureococcus anophagefferens]
MGNIFQRCKDDADDTGRGASRDEPPPAKAPLPEEAKAPPSHAHDHGHGHGHDHGGGEHAQVISLGTATLGGGTLMADREGECAAGAATTFGVEALDGAAPPTEAWVESGHHERLCEPVRAEDHAGTHWHFTITPGGGELWLTDLKGGPLDVPHSAFVALKCASLGRAVKLGIRNLDSNEDEDGVPNMRDGETNYFIFPAVPGTDASWLKGTEWRAAVEVRISAGDGASLEAKPFILVPHSVLNATLDGASFALAETAVLRGANCRVVVDGSAAAAAFGAPTLGRRRRRVLDVRGAVLVLKSVALAGCDAASDDGACVAASAGTVRLDDCAGTGGAVASVADGAALVAVGGSYAGGGYAFAAHGASATVDGGAYAGGGVLRLEAARRAVVGGLSRAARRPSTRRTRTGAVGVAGGTFRFASREAGAALVNGSGAVAVSGAFLRVGDRWCAVLAAGAEGAFAVGGFRRSRGPTQRGAYAAAAACLAEATCYEITATGAAAGWTFAGRDYAGDGVVPFSLGADLRADGAPAASNATCPRSSRSGGDAGRDLDLLLAYSVVVLAIIGAVALSVTGCYVARRSADDVEKPRQVAPGDSSPLPGRQTVAAPLVATAPTDLAAVSARTALDLAAITLPAGDAVVVVAVAAGAPGARQTLSVNFVPPARHRAAAPAVAALRRATTRGRRGASERAGGPEALLTHVLVPFLGAYAACAANEKTLVILQRARAAKTRALLRFSTPIQDAAENGLVECAGVLVAAEKRRFLSRLLADCLPLPKDLQLVVLDFVLSLNGELGEFTDSESEDSDEDASEEDESDDDANDDDEERTVESDGTGDY